MNFIDLLKTFILGVIEGITEWLPVSSTGHMIIFEEFFPVKNFSESFYDLFLVVVQLGAILAVVMIYWKKLFPFSFNKKEPFIKKDIFTLWIKIIISCIPAAVIGILFEDTFDRLFYNATSVAIALITFGILFIFTEMFNKKSPKINSVAEITVKTAVLIGVFQVIAAVFPGVSRSGATILGALLIGVSRTVAAEYTFYLAVPVMAGASLLKLMKFGFDFTLYEIIYLLVGMVTAFVVSILAIKFLIGYVKKHDFKAFGIYRIILGILVLILI
ncbi:MAG: undecaprenyl-diphosphate phosphatase [Ruminococcaceae bacterium]|nr:undecaprenyl-diphosphate phosphatase [Oscillospiraceae bacterium]